MSRLFRYSGSKLSLLPFYRAIPINTKRIIEPYLGSGACILNNDLPGLGFDTNAELVAMWHWLQTCSPKDLYDLNAFVEDRKNKEEKPDVRNMGLDIGPSTYVRVNVTSLVVGQLSSWKVYPQHKLPIEGTIACLPKLKDIEVVLGDASLYKHQDGDFLFLDPPYLGTHANYQEKKQKKSHEAGYDPATTVRMIESTTNPILFTYGTSAPEIFPMYQWSILFSKKVPNMRSGGTVDRTEHVAYLNY